MHLLVNAILDVPPHTTAIAIGVICLILVQLIRASTTRHIRALLQGSAVGIVGGVVIIHSALAGLGLHRVHRISPLLANAAAKASPDREQIVLVGQSLSFYGLDGEQLEKFINGGGNKYQIIQLTVEGVLPIEQDHLLTSYLAHAPRLPTAIFFDFGFDSSYFPAMPWDQMYMQLTIAASDWPHTTQRLVTSWKTNWPGLRDAWPRDLGTAYTHATQLFSDTTSSLGHFVCHVMNCGKLLQVKPLPPGAGYSAGYAYRTGHAATFKPEDIADPVPFQCGTSINPRLSTSLSFRSWQERKYKAQGVPVVAFYHPPLLGLHYRCFAVAFCKAMDPSPCVDIENLALFNEVKSPEKWFDRYHLNSAGVPYYTQAFAGDLIRVLRDGWIGNRRAGGVEVQPR
jgi:hypothetical protein